MFVYFTNRWFVNPNATESLVPAGAIVVFPGGRKADERLELAVELAEKELAPVLFIATDVKQTDLEAAICDGSSYSFPTECRLSSPVNTFGNAVVTAEVAAEQGWRSVILVTSDCHIARSHMLLQRCFDGDIETAVSVKTEGRDRFGRTLHERGAMIQAMLGDRC